MKILFPLLSCFLLAGSAYAREWTNSAGKKIQADFVSVKGEAGAEAVLLKMTTGKTYEVPLSQLSEADQKFVKEQAKPEAPAAAKEPADTKPSIFKDMLKGKLVALEGKRVSKYEVTEEPKYYAFYFSASWCGPCKAFTPKLVEFYKESAGKKKDFEVVFVSNDNDEASMEEYMKTDAMPWPAISFRNLPRMKEINAYAGKGIPCLVLVDRAGNVVSDSYVNGSYVGPNKVMEDIKAKTAP